MRIRRALISVSDKRGLILLAKELRRLKVEIFSTGGTLALLRKEKIKSKSISELTRFPEILDGRVKTLHPKVHGGLLFIRSKAAHKKEAKKQGILPIDLVVVNLYPFAKTIQKPGTTLEEAVEQIDIGGPSMLRSASKNFESVTVVSDPNDYPAVIAELKKLKGATSAQFRKTLALKAFRHTAAYDQQIAQYLSGRFETGKELPKTFSVVYEREAVLRYGENPHQRAALYRPVGGSGKFRFEQLQGKELSYNNILDFEAAVDILREFKEPAACVVKHNNPSGIAANPDILTALEQAIDCDPLSAFGGIVGLNQHCDERAAALVFQKLPFFEVILAPQFSSGALDILKSRKNLRIIQVSGMDEPAGFQLKFAKSGLLLQDEDPPIKDRELKKKLKWVTHEKLKGYEIDDLIFVWKCAKVVKSNAIVLAKGKQTVGIGGGQMSRVDSVKIACAKAGEKARGAFLASDGFFPMPDNIEVAHLHGIRAVIQPGGSIKDQEVIDAANRAKIAMAFTGERHFKH